MPKKLNLKKLIGYKIQDGKPTRVVLVKWRDASTISGWKHLSSSPKITQTLAVKSIAHLVAVTKDSITLTTSVSEDGDVMDPLSIPMGFIDGVYNIKGV